MSAAERSLMQIGENMVADLTRIQQLEACLTKMVEAHEDTVSDSEGHYPRPDTGCIDCTCGTVPDKFNSGRCGYHQAKVLLGLL